MASRSVGYSRMCSNRDSVLTCRLVIVGFFSLTNETIRRKGDISCRFVDFFAQFLSRMRNEQVNLPGKSNGAANDTRHHQAKFDANTRVSASSLHGTIFANFGDNAVKEPEIRDCRVSLSIPFIIFISPVEPHRNACHHL